MKRVYLKPKASFRTDLRSDTLFGCLCWGIREVYSEDRLVEMLERFEAGDPPFRISSAFPFREIDGERIHFLSRPIVRPALLPPPVDVKEAKRQKDFRKRRWVTETTFLRFVTGELDETGYYRSEEWEEPGPAVERTEALHNAIDRLSGGTGRAGTLYAVTEWAIREGGLYFLLDGDEVEAVEGALGLMSHLGMGGDSSLGKGQFDITVEDHSPFETPEQADRFVTLSLYAPREGEVAAFRNGDAWYDLVLRKGKVGGPFLRVDDFWKRSVTMFAEGSTFPLLDAARFYGHNPVVKGPEDGVPFRVQQYGYAFHVPMAAKTE